MRLAFNSSYFLPITFKMTKTSVNMEAVDTKQYEVYLSTVSASIIRTLSEALKEVLTDVNIEFRPSGVKIISVDGSRIAFVHLRLYAEQFEQYFCLREKYTIGVNMLSFFKLLKSIGNNDTLTLYVKVGSENELGILIENTERALKNDIKLSLLDLDDPFVRVPEVVFDSVITMPCVDFQKYCRDLSLISETVKISSRGNEFIMEAEGDFARQKVVIGKSETNDKIRESGRFPLKYLNLFCKSSNLCSNIEICLKDTYPIILLFAVANLGMLRFGLAPILE